MGEGVMGRQGSSRMCQSELYSHRWGQPEKWVR